MLLDYKYDGQRAQFHCRVAGAGAGAGTDGDVATARAFSRSCEESSDRFIEACRAVCAGIDRANAAAKAAATAAPEVAAPLCIKECILDAEICAVLLKSSFIRDSRDRTFRRGMTRVKEMRARTLNTTSRSIICPVEVSMHFRPPA